MVKKKTPPEQAGAKPYRVFVSHATADKWIAKTLCEKIEGVGATTFRDDRDINGGDDERL
ncbi:MAG: toll/interleukin-1 receptor domain-containing protein [Planctomycetes bacterium]|nr:toll/interleukin-1 receptor domain-containing protein [Planctomycetota bacterium]